MTNGCIVGEMALDQTFEEFAAAYRKQGFDKVVERHWPPLTVLGTHAHDFQAKALVIRGEMWLTVNSDTYHLRSGSTFQLDARVPHAERYGGDGATYWVARQSAK